MKIFKEETFYKPEKSRFFYAIIIFFTVFLLSSYFWAKPLYRSIKSWRASELMEKAYLLRDSGFYASAQQRALSAYKLAPYDPKIIRRVATFIESRDPRNALKHLMKLEEMNQINDEDRVKVANLALDVGNETLAREQLSMIDSSSGIQGDSSYKILFLRLGILDGDIDVALKKAKEWGANRPDADPSLQLFYAKLAIVSNRPDLQEEGIALLNNLSGRLDKYGRESLLLFLNIQGLPESAYAKASKSLIEHPEATRNDLLFAYTYRFSLDRNLIELELSNVENLFDLDDDEDLVVLSRWLLQRRLHGKIDELIPLRRAWKNQDLFLILLDSKSIRKEWREVYNMLDADDVPLDRHIVEVFKGRAKLELGDKELAEDHFERAIIYSRDDLKALNYLGGYFDKLGDRAMAKRILKMMASDHRSASQAFAKLYADFRATATEKELIDWLKELVRWNPGDLMLLNEQNYLNLLAGVNVQYTQRDVIKMFEENSNNNAFAVTYALNLYLDGEYDQAYEILNSLNIDWRGNARPGWKVIYAKVLDATGRSKEASIVFGSIDSEELLSIERNFLEGKKMPNLYREGN